MVMDISLLLGYSNSYAIQDGVKIPCKLCQTKIKLENIWLHVGIHILKEDLVDKCGFCGQTSCHSSLTKTSRQRNKTYYKTNSNCPYLFNWGVGRAPKKCTQRNKCTKHLIRCGLCKTDILWKYNFPAHYKPLHGGYRDES